MAVDAVDDPVQQDGRFVRRFCGQFEGETGLESNGLRQVCHFPVIKAAQRRLCTPGVVLRGLGVGLYLGDQLVRGAHGLAQLAEHGIRVVVNLHERGHDPARLARLGLTEVHLPVADFTAPTPDQLGRGVQAIKHALADGQRVAVHCAAGLGRTGTLLACYLVSMGLEPTAAIARVRAARPGSVETAEQQAVFAHVQRMSLAFFTRTQTGALTNTLADRDQLIGQVIVNLNVVLGSLGDQNDQFAKAVDALAELVAGLEPRKEDISVGLAYTNAAAGTITDLLAQARPPLGKTVTETDRAAGIVVADHEYFDNLLNTLPDAYQALARQGIYGDFFSFYLCDIVLKLNGKGGQPVYVKVAGQSTGRCAPR